MHLRHDHVHCSPRELRSITSAHMFEWMIYSIFIYLYMMMNNEHNLIPTEQYCPQSPHPNNLTQATIHSLPTYTITHDKHTHTHTLIRSLTMVPSKACSDFATSRVAASMRAWFTCNRRMTVNAWICCCCCCYCCCICSGWSAPHTLKLTWSTIIQHEVTLSALVKTMANGWPYCCTWCKKSKSRLPRPRLHTCKCS